MIEVSGSILVPFGAVYCEARFSIYSKCRQPEACNFIKKENLAQVFSWEFGQLFKKPFFMEHLRCLLRYHKLKDLRKKHIESNFSGTFNIPDGEKLGFGLHNFDS